MPKTRSEQRRESMRGRGEREREKNKKNNKQFKEVLTSEIFHSIVDSTFADELKWLL